MNAFTKQHFGCCSSHQICRLCIHIKSGIRTEGALRTHEKLPHRLESSAPAIRIQLINYGSSLELGQSVDRARSLVQRLHGKILAIGLLRYDHTSHSGFGVLDILLVREVSQPVSHPIDRHCQQTHDRLCIELGRCSRMATRRNDALGPLETPRDRLAFLTRDQAFQAWHIFVLLMLDMVVEVIHEGVQQRPESRVQGCHVLQLIQSVLDLT